MTKPKSVFKGDPVCVRSQRWKDSWRVTSQLHQVGRNGKQPSPSVFFVTCKSRSCEQEFVRPAKGVGYLIDLNSESVELLYFAWVLNSMIRTL